MADGEMVNDTLMLERRPVRPCFGPLAQGFKCSRRNPRIGSQFQVTKFSTDRSQAQSSRLLWRPDKIDETELDEYLSFVKGLFLNEDFYSEERALYFLMRCEFDIDTARTMLTLQQVVQVDSDSVSEEDDEIQYDEEDYCFVCGDGGSLLLCDAEGCRKVYHIHCAQLEEVPQGKWECPSHFCVVCSSPAAEQYRCNYCANSYCKKHAPASVQRYNADALEVLCEHCLDAPVTGEDRFMSRLHDLHKRRSTPITSTPKIGRYEISLFQLYKEIIRRGGVHFVIRDNAWEEVRDLMDLPPTVKNIDMNKTLKVLYIKILYPYERLFFPRSNALVED